VLGATECDPRTILVVLPTWVGDFVMATPMLRAVRNRFPEARITFLGEANLGDLLAAGDWMDEVVCWPPKDQRRPGRRAYRRLVRSLRERRFDWAVLLPNSFRSALLAFQAGARRRIGYRRDGRGWLLTDGLPVRNRVGRRYVPLPICAYYADLAEALGCPRPDDQLELFTADAAEASVAEKLRSKGIQGQRPLVVITPGAKFGAAKLWLPERFAGVADRLVRGLGAAVVVSCGPGEEPLARQIESTMQEPVTVFVDPRLSLGELAALIRRSDLLLCNDTGPRHFAKAFRVPVVTVFGPTHPEWTRTAYPAERIVRIDVDCGPCQEKVCPLGHLKCMTGVSEEMVFEAAAELLQTSAAASGESGATTRS
jgi:heptosyltransferase-2